MFALAGSFHVVAFAVICLVVPRIEPLALASRGASFRSGQAEAGLGTEPQIVVVQNWFEELKRLVPVN